MNSPAKTPPKVDPYQILSVLFKRYAELAREHAPKMAPLPVKCQSGSVIALCEHAIANGKDYPFDKMNRWLGFTQGVLATVGALDVDAEREYTRPLLHLLHDEPIKSWPPRE